MIGLRDFIIKIDKEFNEKFKTESGIEIYATEAFSADRLSNRFATVINIPLLIETNIKKGDQVMFDPTILYKQSYQGVKQSSVNIVDKENGLYRISPQLIILYRKNNAKEWKGYGQNSLIEPIIDQHEKLTSSFIIIPDIIKEKYERGRAIALYMNDNIDIKKGDKLIINNNGGLPFWINGKEFWWIRNIDIYGKLL